MAKIPSELYCATTLGEKPLDKTQRRLHFYEDVAAIAVVTMYCD